jgi:hypothetical protein
VVCQEEVPAAEEGISGGEAAAGPTKESRPRYGGKDCALGSLLMPLSGYDAMCCTGAGPGVAAQAVWSTMAARPPVGWLGRIPASDYVYG